MFPVPTQLLGVSLPLAKFVTPATDMECGHILLMVQRTKTEAEMTSCSFLFCFLLWHCIILCEMNPVNPIQGLHGPGQCLMPQFCLHPY